MLGIFTVLTVRDTEKAKFSNKDSAPTKQHRKDALNDGSDNLELASKFVGAFFECHREGRFLESLQHKSLSYIPLLLQF